MGDEEKPDVDEATFREANEQIRAAERELAPELDRVPYVCECDDVACHDPILLSAEEYERIRADGATFAIVPGHPSRGETVEEYDHYLVVRKQERGGEVARALDPRREDGR